MLVAIVAVAILLPFLLLSIGADISLFCIYGISFVKMVFIVVAHSLLA